MTACFDNPVHLTSAGAGRRGGGVAQDRHGQAGQEVKKRKKNMDGPVVVIRRRFKTKCEQHPKLHPSGNTTFSINKLKLCEHLVRSGQ